MKTNIAEKSAFIAAKEMWTTGVLALCLIFVLSLITSIVLNGNYNLNLFGIESYRNQNGFGTKEGWDALFGFLLVLPTFAAGLSLYRARKSA